ncbi:hypothetical protein PHYPO_G00136450 [Pangasianodon hypophthalmus]|uniref:Uncharacterized protein n=1 Tax=Pangasianodon hypophthalmus TaxID=310915 RepID=A0A5N5KL73_PANHP|nr:hypothetical protein PHYPO_G00136450 [Pangasianodon hypophthalmus]
MLQLYTAIIESILMSSITGWFGSTTSWEKAKFQCVIRSTTFMTAELRSEQLRQSLTPLTLHTHNFNRFLQGDILLPVHEAALLSSRASRSQPYREEEHISMEQRQ